MASYNQMGPLPPPDRRQAARSLRLPRPTHRSYQHCSAGKALAEDSCLAQLAACLTSTTWETRVAAGDALGRMAEHFQQPTVDDLKDTVGKSLFRTRSSIRTKVQLLKPLGLSMSYVLVLIHNCDGGNGNGSDISEN
eukprot:scaffold67543_cov33-Prasinocladus_malaysianus.AAC.1